MLNKHKIFLGVEGNELAGSSLALKILDEVHKNAK